MLYYNYNNGKFLQAHVLQVTGRQRMPDAALCLKAAAVISAKESTSTSRSLLSSSLDNSGNMSSSESESVMLAERQYP